MSCTGGKNYNNIVKATVESVLLNQYDPNNNNGGITMCQIRMDASAIGVAAYGKFKVYVYPPYNISQIKLVKCAIYDYEAKSFVMFEQKDASGMVIVDGSTICTNTGTTGTGSLIVYISNSLGVDQSGIQVTIIPDNTVPAPRMTVLGSQLSYLISSTFTALKTVPPLCAGGKDWTGFSIQSVASTGEHDASNNNAEIYAMVIKMTGSALKTAYGRFVTCLSAITGLNLVKMTVRQFLQSGTFTEALFTKNLPGDGYISVEGYGLCVSDAGEGFVTLYISNSTGAPITGNIKMQTTGAGGFSLFGGKVTMENIFPSNIQLPYYPLPVSQPITITKTFTKDSGMHGSCAAYKYSINGGAWTAWPSTGITAQKTDSIKFQTRFSFDDPGSGYITTPCGQSWTGLKSSGADLVYETPTACVSTSNYVVAFYIRAK